MYVLRYLLMISVLLTTPLLAFTASAQAVADDANTLALPLTQATAAELAKTETGGRVLSVNEEMFEEKAIFRIKVLHENGTVRTYRIERDTGNRL